MKTVVSSQDGKQIQFYQVQGDTYMFGNLYFYLNRNHTTAHRRQSWTSLKFQR